MILLKNEGKTDEGKLQIEKVGKDDDEHKPKDEKKKKKKTIKEKYIEDEELNKR